MDFLIPGLPEGESKCVLYIARHTFGFHKDRDVISLGQFINGIQTKQGKVLDYGTGLSRPVVVEALKNLEKAEIIKSVKSKMGNIYQLNLSLNIERAIRMVGDSRKFNREKRKLSPKKQQLFKVVRKPNQLGNLTESSKETLLEVVRKPNLQKKVTKVTKEAISSKFSFSGSRSDTEVKRLCQ